MTAAPRTPRQPKSTGKVRAGVGATLRRLTAWREADELEGRELMREGEWIVP